MNTTELKIPPFLMELINNDIEISIEKNTEIGIYFNLHLEAKSGMYLYFKGESWRVAMRYNDDFAIDDINDLIRYAKYGMHGRDFIHYSWAILINKEVK